MFFGTTDLYLDSNCLNCLSCEKRNWTLTPSSIGSYDRQAGRQADRQAGRQAGRLADEIQLDYEISTVLYRLNYLDFYFVDIRAMLLIVLEVHFTLLFLNKVYFRVCFGV